MKLYVGCGSIPKEGFINIDPSPTQPEVREGDLQSLGRMFAPETVDLVRAEMVLEHVPFDEIPSVLYMIWNILRPGGRVEFLTPNAPEIMRSLLAEPFDYLNWQKGNHILLNSFVGMSLGDCHKALIGPDYIKAVLAHEGFSDIFCQPTGSRDWGLLTVATKACHVDRVSLKGVEYQQN